LPREEGLRPRKDDQLRPLGAPRASNHAQRPDGEARPADVGSNELSTPVPL
jgi:hypothetical protein